MQIVFAPHPALRQVANPITTVDKKLLTFLQDINHTLQTNKRRGVGLAAPQVDKQWRLFITYLAPTTDDGDEDESVPRTLSYYLNPRITKTSAKKVLGGSPDSRPLEGCLSIPKIYGPVPRFDYIEVEYESIKNNQLVTTKKSFTDFEARLAQHEIDHLDGILFTDHSLALDLPVYQEDRRGKLTELTDRTIIELF